MSEEEEDERVARETDVMKILISVARQQLNEIERQKREKRQEYSRGYYAKNRDKALDYQRQSRAKQREADPEHYRKLRRERAKRWRDKHKDEVNAKMRAKYRANPEATLARRAKFYAANADVIKAHKREHYAETKERVNAKLREGRELNSRRANSGLPPPRTHPTSSGDRDDNLEAANAFFIRAHAHRELIALRKEAGTPDDVWAAWERDCRKARATHHLWAKREVLARLHKELGRKHTESSARDLEDARLDAIAKEVNDRLRRWDAPRRSPRYDPAAPHTLPQQPDNSMGMNQ